MSFCSPVILDIAGTHLTEVDRARLAHPLTGGLILFARNWESRAQLTELCAEIKDVRGDLLICVDHEGGRVQRFRSDGFTHLPPMRALGELWMHDGCGPEGSGAMRAQDAASAAGYVLGAELRACGVDFSFTPVLDLDWLDEATGASRSSVIGDRAFHADARVVTLLAKSLAHGLLRAGLQHCGKHFPGHGYVRADSHTDIPVDRRSLRAILAADAAPYGWLTSTLDAVMPAHVVYPRVDARPAGYSAPLAAGHSAHPSGLHRRGVQRRPLHGRRADTRRPGGEPHRSGAGRARRRLRPGAAVQPVARWRRGAGRSDRRPGARPGSGPLAAARGQRRALPGAAAARAGARLGRADALARLPARAGAGSLSRAGWAPRLAAPCEQRRQADAAPGRASAASRSRPAGKSTENTDPCPGTLAMCRRASWRCSTCLTMARPRPVPLAAVPSTR